VLFEIVRPGMEDSESAEKQENTGIGPASAPNRAMSTEVVTSSSCAGLTRSSIFFAGSLYEERWIAGSSPAMTARVSSPRRRGPMITAGGYGSRLSPRFREGGPGRHRLGRAKHQPAAVRNDRGRSFIVSGLLFTMTFATPTCLSPDQAHGGNCSRDRPKRARRGCKSHVVERVSWKPPPSLLVACGRDRARCRGRPRFS
jgi:hypothetical protein